MTKSTITREESVQAVFDLKVGYRLGFADIEILKRVARMALAEFQAEPVTKANKLGYSPVIPDGYVMVPREPTAEMIWAAKYAIPSTVGWQSFKDVYIAMLAAAPQEVKGE
ncbi:hypothetical protein [Klebsiella aerogenes]|uniref:hypothetical protein n=1 Tax=Klebsiella aerogenes TaxID=548 RepID=UPI00339C815A